MTPARAIELLRQAQRTISPLAASTPANRIAVSIAADANAELAKLLILQGDDAEAADAMEKSKQFLRLGLSVNPGDKKLQSSVKSLWQLDSLLHAIQGDFEQAAEQLAKPPELPETDTTLESEVLLNNCYGLAHLSSQLLTRYTDLNIRKRIRDLMLRFFRLCPDDDIVRCYYECSYHPDEEVARSAANNLRNVSLETLLLPRDSFDASLVMCSQLVGPYVDDANLERSEGLLRSLLDHPSATYQTYALYAWLLLRQGKYEEAHDSFQDVLANQNRPRIEMSVGMVLTQYALGNQIAADEIFQDILDSRASTSYSVTRCELAALTQAAEKLKRQDELARYLQPRLVPSISGVTE